MMISIQQMQNGINRFVHEEFCAMLTDGWKWGIETLIGLHVNNLPAYLEEIDKNPMFSPLHLVDNGMVDVDKLYVEAIKHMPKELVFYVPIMNKNITITKENVDTLYNMIKQGGSGYGVYGT